MRTTVDPRQNELFDRFDALLSKAGRDRIEKGWPALFRHAILELMPVGVLAGEFSPDMGAPTKELYSMAGLLLIKEFEDWTTREAADAYMFHVEVQYALNLRPVNQSLCERTIERYEKIFVDNDLAAVTMERVTGKLVALLDQDVSRQRLDSTHILSDMAVFGRTRLMGVTIKRFLTQLKRHDRAGYDALPEAFRARYAPSQAKLFGDVARDRESRGRLRQEVAEDLRLLIERFADAARVCRRPTYQALVRVFGEQCEIVEDRIEMKAHTGGDVTQNPSDPDATYDGHKGPGYQAQLTETCSDANDVQLVTSVIPQTAAEDDGGSVPAILDDLERQGTLPDLLHADTHYGSDANAQRCAAKGVDLQSPVAGDGPREDVHALNVDDFVVNEETQTVERCPAGHAPVSSVHDAATGRTRTVMPLEACGRCEHAVECPVRRVHSDYVLYHTAKERRLVARRREQATEAFREDYRTRSGIESTNGGLKRRTGLGRVRARGRPKVFHRIRMKVCGWNILRAAASKKARTWVAEIMEKRGSHAPVVAISSLRQALTRLMSPLSALLPANPTHRLQPKVSLAA